MILQLLLQRQLVKLSSQRELPIDFFLRYVEVLHVEEANVLSGVSELIGQLLFAVRLVEEAKIEGDEFGPVN